MTLQSDQHQTARDLIGAASRVVVLTGAGMSAESGVPTFRDAQTGLWERFSPEQLATEEAFRADPELVWSWYLWRARMVRACEPNAGHRALGVAQNRLAERCRSLQIVTQNVDDLHERGGAEVLAHVHGSLFEYRCADCGAPADFELGTAEPGSVGSEEDLERMMQVAPPACERCMHGVMRPGIVWFGEMLPPEDFNAAQTAVEKCDLALVVGTSGLVQPAASLPYLALESGAAVVEINPESTPLSEEATVTLRGTAAELLPGLLLESGGASS